MGFVERHVTYKTFGKSATDLDPLHLRARRPDLWELPLTCENTNTLVPYLDVINRVLERYVAGDAGVKLVGSVRLTREARAKAATERAANAYKLLSTAENSFRQPFHLPLAELRTYLRHFGLSLAEIVEAVRGWGLAAARESLRFSPRAWAIVATPNIEAATLGRLYGAPQPLESMEVQGFLEATGLSRAELDRLITLRSVKQADAVGVEVVKDDPQDLQPSREELTGLGAPLLDRVHRFVRLWRALPWELEALDFVVRRDGAALTDAGTDTAEREQALRRIAALRRAQRRLDVDVDVLCALTGPIPLEPFAPKQIPLFDRLFNPPRLAPNEEDRWVPRLQPGAPGNLPLFTHPALATLGVKVEIDEPNYHRLLGGLGVSGAELELLLQHLLASVADLSAGTVQLTHARLSLLYRHAKLTKRLGLTVQELTAALRVVQDTVEARVSSLEDLQALLAFLDWQRQSPLSVGDVHFVARGPALNALGYRFAEVELTSLLEQAAEAASAVTFTAGAFADVPDLEPSDVAVLVASLTDQGLIDELSSDAYPLSYRVAAAFDPSQPLTFGPDDADPEVLSRLNAQQSKVRSILRALLPARSGLSRLAVAFEVDGKSLALLLSLAGLDMTDRERVLRLLERPDPDTPLAPDLLALLRRLEETQRWAQVLELDADALSFVADHIGVFKTHARAADKLRKLASLEHLCSASSFGHLEYFRHFA